MPSRKPTGRRLGIGSNQLAGLQIFSGCADLFQGFAQTAFQGIRILLRADGRQSFLLDRIQALDRGLQLGLKRGQIIQTFDHEGLS